MPDQMVGFGIVWNLQGEDLAPGNARRSPWILLAEGFHDLADGLPCFGSPVVAWEFATPV